MHGITISTSEMRGLLSDVIPFAATDEDLPWLNCVRLEYFLPTSDLPARLVSSATDQYRVARCWWAPEVDEHDDAQETIVSLYDITADTDPFSVRIELQDAKNVVKAFALKGKKKQGAPVTITTKNLSVIDNTYTVSFTRAGTGGWPALEVNLTGRGAPRKGSNDMPEADIHQLLEGLQNIEAHLPGVCWLPKGLAAFGKVRGHGPLEMEFTGEFKAVRFHMGTRFDGVMMPTKPQDWEPEKEPDDEFEGMFPDEEEDN